MYTRLDPLTYQILNVTTAIYLGHFADECKKSKYIKKDKDYLELEAKYQALLKKQQGKAYISEGKC